MPNATRFAAILALICALAATPSMALADTAGPMTVAHTIDLPANPTGVAVSPDGTRVYVTATEGSQLIALDASSGEYLWTSEMPAFPRDIVVTADGASGYVALTNKSVVEVELASGSVTKTFALPGTPIQIAIQRGDKRLWVLHNRKSLSVMDLASGEILTTMPTGKSPEQLLLSNDGKRAYVLDAWYADEVRVYNAKKKKPLTTIEVRPAPNTMALNPQGTRLILSHDPPGPSSSLWYSSINTGRLAVTGGFKLSESAAAMSYNPAEMDLRLCEEPPNEASCWTWIADPGQVLAMVTEDEDDGLTLMDLTTQDIISTTPLDGSCKQGLIEYRKLALAPDGSRAFVLTGCLSSRAGGTLMIVDLTRPVESAGT